MRASRRTWGVLASLFLAAGIVAVLLVNLAVTANLPSQVYTTEQRAYLAYNRGREISQVAPTWNLVDAEGAVQPVLISYVRETRVRARLDARIEQRERVRVTVYDLDFDGEYYLVYEGPASPASTTVQLFFPFPARLETLHEVQLRVDGKEPAGVQYAPDGIRWQTRLEPGAGRRVSVSYKADGASSFAYTLHHGQRADVDVVVTVAGLAGSTVPRNALPATRVEPTDTGETLAWQYDGLIVDRDVKLTLPAQPTFTQRIASLQDEFRLVAGAAPLLVILFLACLAAAFRLGRLRVGLPTYLLAGCGLALFFPLVLFLSGLVNLPAGSVLALLLVSGMLLAFLGLTAGWSQVRWRVGALLVAFLGFFALGPLTPWPGLMLTAGGLLLVGTFMLLYVRRPPEPEPGQRRPLAVEVANPGPGADEDLEGLAEEAPAEVKAEAAPGEDVGEPTGFYCPVCARALDDDYRFCPGCGYDTGRVRACAACGARQLVPESDEPVHCLHCGARLG